METIIQAILNTSSSLIKKITIKKTMIIIETILEINMIIPNKIDMIINSNNRIRVIKLKIIININNNSIIIKALIKTIPQSNSHNNINNSKAIILNSQRIKINHNKFKINKPRIKLSVLNYNLVLKLTLQTLKKIIFNFKVRIQILMKERLNNRKINNSLFNSLLLLQ